MKTSTARERHLDGVPEVHTYRGGPRPPEDDPLPACVQSFLEYVGNPLGLADRGNPARTRSTRCILERIAVSAHARFASQGERMAEVGCIGCLAGRVAEAHDEGERAQFAKPADKSMNAGAKPPISSSGRRLHGGSTR